MLKIIPEPLQVVTNIHYAHCLKSEEWEKLDGAFQTNQSRDQIGSLFEPRQATDDDFIYTTYILICQGFAHLEMEFGDEVQARKTLDLTLGYAQCISVHPETWTFSAEIRGGLHINLWEFRRSSSKSELPREWERTTARSTKASLHIRRRSIRFRRSQNLLSLAFTVTTLN